MIRLIVSDIDGTLVQEGRNRINPEYLSVIQELTDLGIQFAVASGRQNSSIDAIFHDLKDRIFYLGDNGACIEKGGKLVSELRMDPEKVRALFAEVAKIPGCHPLVSVREGCVTDDTDPFFLDLIFHQYKLSGKVVENMDAYADRCIKLSLYGDDGARKLYGFLGRGWKEEFSVHISGERWVDINDSAATKGNGVAYIQNLLGITPEETVVFGDNFNDISMLRRGERSYASVLSHPDVKKEARYVAASYEEDGVLQVLKELKEEACYGN